jgi:hypothetical protein
VTRRELERHWEACDASDPDAAREIYHEDVVVEWPQSGERVPGRANLKAMRETHLFAEPFDPPRWRTRWVERM